MTPTHSDHTNHEQLFRTRFWVCLFLSLPVLAYSEALQEWLGITVPPLPGSMWLAPIFDTLIFYYGGIPFLRLAIPELANRQPGMMALIALAISVAFGYSLINVFLQLGNGFFWELVTLIDIMLLGHWQEMRSVRQAKGALNELAQLMPDTAERLNSDGETETVPIDGLNPDDLLLIRPGTSIPADGEIIEGESTVNEAMITGESTPVEKQPGDSVIGGTLNRDGSLRVRVTATGDETALAGIMRLVNEAQASHSPAQALADRAAGWLFYVSLGTAILTGIGWMIATGFNIVALPLSSFFFEKPLPDL